MRKRGETAKSNATAAMFMVLSIFCGVKITALDHLRRTKACIRYQAQDGGRCVPPSSSHRRRCRLPRQAAGVRGRPGRFEAASFASFCGFATMATRQASTNGRVGDLRALVRLLFRRQNGRFQIVPRWEATRPALRRTVEIDIGQI